MRDQETIEQACERIVRQEVLCCVSGVVSTLAKGYGAVLFKVAPDLDSLCLKANELTVPMLDFEEAATQAGWEKKAFGPDKVVKWWNPKNDDGARYCEGHEAHLCEDYGLDAYEWEIFEHWAVTQWLADALIAQGERVDTDFEGLCVWARTTTGQGIAMDSVIRRVVEKLRADYAELTAKRA